MKTIQSVQLEINNTLLRIEEYRARKEKVPSKEKETLFFLRSMLAYLETSPSKEYLERERDRLDKLIGNIKGRYAHWVKNCPPSGVEPKKYKTHYAHISGLSDLRRKYKAIQYLLA